MTLKTMQCLSCGAPLGQGTCCSYCGTRHIFSSGDAGGAQIACPSCGSGNRPSASNCVQCRGKLMFACPECREKTPCGSRFCSECRIAFASYRQARVQHARDRLERDDIAEHVLNWLDLGWFRARNIRGHLVIMDRARSWLPTWTFRARMRGRVQGQNAQTHYRTESRTRFQEDPDDDPFGHDLGFPEFPPQIPEMPQLPPTFSRPRERRGQWITEPISVPYTVWVDVGKDFDRRWSVTEAAADEDRLYEALDGEPKNALADGTPTAQGDWDRVILPESHELAAYAHLRSRAEAELSAELLTKVELFEAQFLEPELSLLYRPVWEIIYRYKRKRARLWIDGATLATSGQKVSLLDQWFG